MVQLLILSAMIITFVSRVGKGGSSFFHSQQVLIFTDPLEIVTFLYIHLEAFNLFFLGIKVLEVDCLHWCWNYHYTMENNRALSKKFSAWLQD